MVFIRILLFLIAVVVAVAAAAAAWFGIYFGTKQGCLSRLFQHHCRFLIISNR